MFEIKRTAANAGDFERARFVCKAAHPNRPEYPFAAIVHVEWTRTGSRLVACDGLRLHVAEIRMRIPRGDYKPVMSKDSVRFGDPAQGINFPDWRMCVPENAVRKGTLNLEKTGMGKNSGLAAGMSLVFSDFVEKTGEVVNIRYLDDLPKTEWTVSVHKDKKTVILLEEKDAGRETYAVFVTLVKAA